MKLAKIAMVTTLVGYSFLGPIANFAQHGIDFCKYKVKAKQAQTKDETLF